MCFLMVSLIMYPAQCVCDGCAQVRSTEAGVCHTWPMVNRPSVCAHSCPLHIVV
jgi:hypothetical protein